MMTDAEKAAFLAERAGCLTASRMKDAMAFLKTGKPAEARTKYMHELLAERLTGHSAQHFVNDAMKHGKEYEDEAKQVYAARYQVELGPERFVRHPEIEFFGATPDATIGADGLAEFKCPTSAKFLAWVLAGEVPDEHKAQMCVQLLCTGRQWCEFVAYDPRIKDQRRRLFVRRYTPTAEELKAVEDAARAFLGELDAMFDAFVEAA